MQQRKTLQELTLLDRFLFAEAMEHPENLQTVLEIILGKDLVLQHIPQAEKEVRLSPDFHSIRVDVWTKDEDDVVYDAEVQQQDTHNLPQRSRYYQSLIDSKLLDPGMDYRMLNPVVIILIAPFDIFGKDRYRYTFSMRCEEETDVTLHDGAIRIFLNTRGTDEENITPELKELLYFMEHTNEERQPFDSPKLCRLQDSIRSIKKSEKVGIKYMQAWEEKLLFKQEGHAEGLAEGRAVGRAEGEEHKLLNQISKKLQKGQSAEQIAEALEETPETIRALMARLA